MKTLTLAVLAAVLLAGCAPEVATTGPADPSLIVHDDQPGQAILAGIFGSNIQWENGGDGLIQGNDWAPGALGGIGEMGVSSLRFPGGDLANTYRWKSGTGALAKRPKGLGYAGTLLPSSFGTDELLTLCQSTRNEPMITVNVAAGSAEAADWVSYVNGNAAKPHAIYWEVGNELYNPNQPGHLDAATYAQRFIEFRNAMRARDASIKVGLDVEVTFTQAAWMANVYPFLLTWNEDVLKAAGQQADFVSLHFYAPQDKLWSEKTLAQTVWASPMVFTQNVARLRAQLAKYARPDTQLLVTEYGTAFADKVAPSARIASTQTALYDASMLFAFARDGGIARAQNWSLSNNSQYGTMVLAANTPMQKRPAYTVYAALKDWAGARLLPMDVGTPNYAVSAIGNVPALPSVPVVDSLAALDANGRLRIALVNRSIDQTLPVSIVTQTPRRPGTSLLAVSGGPAAAQWVQTGALTVTGSGKNWTLNLPPMSFATLALEAATP